MVFLLTPARGDHLDRHRAVPVLPAQVQARVQDGASARLAPRPVGATLTAGINDVDDADQSLGAAFQAALQRLVDIVFGDQDAMPAAPR
ncbi:hypothetical protein ACFQ8T_01080 [Isoptericola sp. NPDC056618]|uniref:hypothetical protein n=1 Tax=Isoptericola sp. NPDC056618 TaxID=3345878 RepID=UPI0036809C89